MKVNSSFAPLLLVLAVSGLAQGYKVAGSIQIGGTGGWDYLSADSSNRRLYVSHGTEVVVVDLDSEKPVGRISGMQGIHGIAIADDLGAGFISDGRANDVVMFSLKDLSVQKKVAAGTNPDGIVYDPVSKRVFAFNGRSQDATAIDAASGTVAGTIKLDGKPEFPVSDGKGSVYDNIEDKSEIVRINSTTLKVEATWSVSPCDSPSGLAIDTANRRLFAVCDNKMMAVVDADSGKVVATPPIGEGPDAAVFDAGTKLAFSSNGRDGTLTVVSESGKDSYSVAETVNTARGARTMALDTTTHKIYLATASFGPTSAASATNPRPRPTILPGSFKLIVLSK
ncbi:MAG: YncE family protein [Bryobacteraceae bacterium]